jgi:hypothetical protein
VASTVFPQVRQLVAGFARIRTVSSLPELSEFQLRLSRTNHVPNTQNCFKNRKSPLYKSRMSVIP